MAELDDRYEEYKRLADEHGASAVEKLVSKYQRVKKAVVAFLTAEVIPVAAVVLGSDSKSVAALQAAVVAITGGVYASKNRRR